MTLFELHISHKITVTSTTNRLGLKKEAKHVSPFPRNDSKRGTQLEGRKESCKEACLERERQ